METQTFTDKTLHVEQSVSDDSVRLVWRGKSNDREPGRFLMPILTTALERATAAGSLVLDFTELEYMNSSTFTPLVKLLEQASRTNAKVTLEYSQARKWQQLSFAALRAFATSDGRIAIRAK